MPVLGVVRDFMMKILQNKTDHRALDEFFCRTGLRKAWAEFRKLKEHPDRIKSIAK
jgi:hypothetical protein